MANKEYKVKISTDSSDAVSGINNTADALNNLAAAEDNVTKSTEEASVALKSIGDNSASIDNAKNAIKSLQGATGLLTGAIATTTGTLALFGAESEKLGDIEKKVQGAIALAIGVRQTASSALLLVDKKRFIQEKALQAATKVSTAVQAAYNAVLSANPIALIVLAIAGFITALISLKDRVKVVSDAFEAANRVFQQFLEFIGLGLSAEEKAAAASKKLASEKEAQYKRELELLKARGAAEGEIFAKSRQILVEQLNQLKQGTKEYADTLNEILALEASFNTKQNAEAQKRRDEEKAAAQKQRDELKKRAEGIAKDAELVGLSEGDKAKLLAKRAFDERIKGFKEGSQEFKNALLIFNAEIAKIEEEARAKEQAKKDADLEKAKEQEEKRLNSIRDILTAFREEQENIDADTIQKRLNLEEDRALAELELLNATEEEKGRILDFYAKKRIEAQKLNNLVQIQLELDLFNAIGSIFGQLANLAEEGTAASKALALTEIAIGTATGFINGLVIAQQAAKAAGPAAPFVFPLFYASQIASVLGAANQAKRILAGVPGPGGGASFSTPVGNFPGSQLGFGSEGGVFQPGGFGGSNSPGPQGAPITGGDNDGIIRAYVLAGDVTSAQAANAKLKQKRTL